MNWTVSSELHCSTVHPYMLLSLPLPWSKVELAGAGRGPRLPKLQVSLALTAAEARVMAAVR